MDNSAISDTGLTVNRFDGATELIFENGSHYICSADGRVIESGRIIYKTLPDKQEEEISPPRREAQR